MKTQMKYRIRPNENICLLRVMGLKILGRVRTHIFNYFFSGKNIILCISKGISPFKMEKIGIG